MSGLLPASPAARRREEAVRAEFRREALDRIEGKLDTLVGMMKGGAKALPQPTIITEADVDDLALDLADGAVILPRGAVVSKVTQLFGDECRHLATQVTVGLLQWTPRQLLEQGLVKGNRWDWSLYQRLVSAVPERVDRWTRPYEVRGPEATLRIDARGVGESVGRN
jgi:hypothetical protein